MKDEKKTPVAKGTSGPGAPGGTFPNRRHRRPAVPPSPLSIPLTARQRELLRFIAGWVLGHGMPPSYDEMALGLGVASPNGVQCHVDALVRKGYLLVERGTARGMRLAGCTLSIRYDDSDQGRRLALALLPEPN